MNNEADKVLERYHRRSERKDYQRWNPVTPVNIMIRQEKYRQTARYLRDIGEQAIGEMKVLEVGCGTGINLADLIALGVTPSNITGVDILPDSIEQARAILPPAVKLICGDVQSAPLDTGSFDLVLQHTVFTSLLDADYKRVLADQLMSWLKPGGNVLWYDFVYDNPGNKDVKGIPFKEIAYLFPGAEIQKRRLTLAPPISRLVCKLSPSLYTLLNSISLLRTHMYCRIIKPV